MGEPYRGPDRRCALPDDGAGAGALARAAATGAGAGAVLAGVAPAGVEAQVAVAAVVGVAPLVVATVLLLCAWRAGGRARPAHAAVALALAGGAGPLSAWLASGAADPAATGPVVAVALAAGLLAAAPHARAARSARRTTAVHSDLRPAAALLASSGLVLAAGAGAAAVVGPPAWSTTWSMTWSPLWSLPWSVGVTAALGAAGGAAVAEALASLRAALRGQHLRVLRAVADLHRSAVDLRQDRLLRHDARSALAAVRAASAVLTGEQRTALDPVAQRELAAAVHEELGRVERLLGPPGRAAAPTAAQPRPGVVDLRQAVAPLVLAWRARGLDVTGPPPGPPVLGIGHEDAVRRAVGNLLDNAQRHAPGAAVTISAAATAASVVLVVHDDGPGLPAGDREAAFEAGTSLAPGSAGEGLGLASARALAEADGGSLRLLDADRGARFELHLPPAHETSEEVAAR